MALVFPNVVILLTMWCTFLTGGTALAVYEGT